MNKIVKDLTLLLLAGALVACGGKSAEKQATTTKKESEKVKVQTLSNERIAKNLELSATLEGYETMNISPSITGHIEHIYVEVGSRVQKGSMLVRMDQTQLNTTRINLNSTKVELDRVTSLKASGSISEQVYDQTKAGYDQLVETERFQNENTFVRAQFSGIISAKNYEDGEMYTGAPILTLTQISRLKAIINIHVKTTLALGQIDAIVVPYQSVLKLTGSNERYVFTNHDGTAHRVAVTLGQRFDDRIEIIPVIPGDLKEGDQLVVTGQARLVDGSKLEIVEN